MELLNVWYALLRRKWIFLQAVVFFTVGAGLLALVLPKHYLAAAKISVEASDASLSILGDLDLGEMASTLNGSSDDMMTKISLAQMRPVLEEVVWKLQLRDYNGRLLSPEKLLAPGIDGAILSMPMMTIEQAQGTNILVVAGEANTPELASLVADTTVEVFLKLSVAAEKQETTDALTFVKSQLEELSGQYDADLAALALGQQAESVIELDSETKAAVTRVNNLLNELDATNAEIREVGAQLRERGEQNLKENPELVSPASAAANSTLKSLRDKLTELRLGRSTAALDKTEIHPDVVAFDKQIQAVLREIEMSQRESHELDPAMETLSVSLAGLYQRKNQIVDTLERTVSDGAALPDKMRRLAKLQLAVSATQTVYESLLEQQYQIAVAEAMTVSDMKLVEPSKFPDKPDSPKLLVFIILGGFIGVCAGASLVFLMEYVDDSVRGQEDVKLVWQLPVLGFIPRYKLANGARFIDSIPPTDPLAESYRGVRSGITFAGVDQAINVLTVTSCAPSEGKSTFCTNLGICLAADGKRVIIVDCDLRRPTQHKSFPILTNTSGVSSVLSGSANVQDAVQQTPVANLSVLTSGPVPSNPGRLVESLRLRSMLTELARSYDMVIVDAPPMLAVADAIALGRASKGVLMLLEAGKTTRRMLSDVKLRFESAGVEPIGVVLNKVDPRSGNYGYYRKYAQQYTKPAAPAQAGEAS